MKLKSLSLKVSLIVAVMIAIIIFVIYFMVSSLSDTLVANIAARQAEAANVAFAREMETLQGEAFSRAGRMSYSPDVINSILNGDDAALKNALLFYGSELDLVTVCDTEGNVIVRMHNDTKGDNVLNQRALRIALETGVGISTIEGGTAVGMSTRGSAAIKDFDGNIIGAITAGHDLSRPEYMLNIKAMTNSEVTLFAGDTRLSTTVKDTAGNYVIGTQASDLLKDIVLTQGREYDARIELFGSYYFAHYSPLIIDNQIIGMLFNGLPVDAALDDQNNMMNMVLMIGIVCGLACILLIIFYNFMAVSRPLKKISVYADKIKTGDIGISSSTTSKIDVRSSDEIGMLARSLEQAYNQLRGYVGEIKDRMQGMSEGDLSTESTYDFQGDFVLIKDSINNIVHNLSKTMSEVSNASTQVSMGAKQVADGSQSLAQGSTEQAASVEELSSSVADIALKTKANAEMAGKAASLADAIRNSAEKGSRQMDEMISAVKDINQSSQNISKVIKVIDDIAFQTNILALNAAVEAARAGQHGKGFAVVAEEVRNLASKSAEAAKDTSTMIQDSMEKAELGSRIAGETAVSLTEIVSGINESTALIIEIAKSSEEQSQGISHVNSGIDQVANVVQQNSATAQESAATSEEMSSQSSLLQHMISKFKL